jgi:hypothetical protein
MKSKILKLVSAAILPFIVLLSSLVPVSALLQYGYIISSYDVDVKILKDGTLDITEKVKYSHLGNSNNAVILIDRREDEEIEIINVYTLKKSEYIKCERLSAGQWDANVFTGTYSAIQESDLVRLKIYGSFTNQQATFVVQYKVKNAIKRYKDIAEYKRYHVFKNWEGYISSINIDVRLPKYTNQENIKSYLHGVLVGQKNISDRRRISYIIPNTVPGEYVEARIAFPEYLVSDAPVTEDINYSETLTQEEKEYSESDKSDLLRARENAAKEVGRLAWNEKMRKRMTVFFAVISLFASYLGMLTILRTGRELKAGNEKTAFELQDIAQISPPEAGFLLKGRAGARAFFSGLLHSVYKGRLEMEINIYEGKDHLSFKIPENAEIEDADITEQHLLDCVKDFSETTGSFCPGRISAKRGAPDSVKLTRYYKAWSDTIKNDFASKNTLDPGQLYYRNLCLILGAILFAAGCIVPVAMSIWSGYLMLPVGFLLFWYALNIQKRTQYRLTRVRTLIKLRKLISDKDFNIDDLPDTISDPVLLLAFGIIFGVENKLLETDCYYKHWERAKDLIYKAVKAINNSLVSNIE